MTYQANSITFYRYYIYSGTLTSNKKHYNATISTDKCYILTRATLVCQGPSFYLSKNTVFRVMSLVFQLHTCHDEQQSKFGVDISINTFWVIDYIKIDYTLTKISSKRLQNIAFRKSFRRIFLHKNTISALFTRIAPQDLINSYKFRFLYLIAIQLVPRWYPQTALTFTSVQTSYARVL